MKISFALLCLASCLTFTSFVTANNTPQTTEFYFIRHGESEVNREATRIGGLSSWVELTPEGKEAARIAGKRFKEIKFDAFYASDTIRTQQTARYFFENYSHIHQALTLDPTLREKNQGDWTGRFRNEVYTPEIKALMNWDFIPGDEIKGESEADVARRMVNWVKAKAQEHPNQRLLIFSHGLAIKCMWAELMGIDYNTILKIFIRNVSLTVVKFHDGEFSVPVLNDMSHFENDI